MNEKFLSEIREERKHLDAKRIELNLQLNQLGKEMFALHEKCPHDNIEIWLHVDAEDPPSYCPDCGYFN